MEKIIDSSPPLLNSNNDIVIQKDENSIIKTPGVTTRSKRSSSPSPSPLLSTTDINLNIKKEKDVNFIKDEALQNNNLLKEEIIIEDINSNHDNIITSKEIENDNITLCLETNSTVKIEEKSNITPDIVEEKLPKCAMKDCNSTPIYNVNGEVKGKKS